MIPAFNKIGNLLPGKHRATFAEIKGRFGFNEHRLLLLEGFKNLLIELKRAGCDEIWLNGSFVTKKEFPENYDMCFQIKGVDPDLMDPLICSGDRDERKKKYRGDIFPNFIEGGSGKPFDEFFQEDRDGNPKGIIVIKPQEEND
ncbi:MAG: hypothetical protein HQK84_00890 [Nitrospinae bacterium]|nr:hypothetical protein [Nitrospinota bacterium]